MDRLSAPVSYLPSLLLPCPECGCRLELKAVECDPVARELGNITHGCARCGTELVRTVRLGVSSSQRQNQLARVHPA